MATTDLQQRWISQHAGQITLKCRSIPLKTLRHNFPVLSHYLKCFRMKQVSQQQHFQPKVLNSIQFHLHFFWLAYGTQVADNLSEVEFSICRFYIQIKNKTCIV